MPRDISKSDSEFESGSGIYAAQRSSREKRGISSRSLFVLCIRKEENDDIAICGENERGDVGGFNNI